MKTIIKRVPVPLGGVMLGWAALGNLLQAYGQSLRYICGGVSAFLLLLLLLKLLLFPGQVREDMQNPVMASVSGTLPMGIMLLTTYLEPAAHTAALTFPFVIGAVAVTQTAARLAAAGQAIPFLTGLGRTETVVAAILALYVFVRYMRFLYGAQSADSR